MNNSLVKTQTMVCMLFLLYIIILPHHYMEYDMTAYRDWALYIHRHGLQNAYQSGTNYPPVVLYALYIFGMLQGTDANIINKIYNIKIIFLLFEFLPVIVLCCFRQRIFAYRIPYLYLLLNVAYLFNAMVWGQSDGMFTNIALLSLLTAIVHPVAGMALFVLAVNTKLQAIALAPVMLIILVYSIRSKKTLAAGLFATVATQILVLIPFILSGQVSKMIYVLTHNVDYFDKLSLSAFNIWYLVMPGNPYFTKSSDGFGVFSYKIIGLILFCLALTATAMPMLKKLLQLRKNNLPLSDNAYATMFLGTGIICLSFFYFNVQMHERYAHPIIIFFFFYGVVSRNYKLYILASIPYFLSLDKSFAYPDGYLPIVHYKIIYASRIIALWYTATLVYSCCLYYRLVKQPGTEQKITM